jgi:hypothetical protein
MNRNNFLYIKDIPERTFDSSEDMLLELLLDDLTTFSSCILLSWHTLLSQRKCILSLGSAFLTYLTILKECSLFMGVLKEKPFRIILQNLNFMKKVI